MKKVIPIIIVFLVIAIVIISLILVIQPREISVGIPVKTLQEIKQEVNEKVSECEVRYLDYVCMSLANNDINECNYDQQCKDQFNLFKVMQTRDAVYCATLTGNNKIICDGFIKRNANTCDTPFLNFFDTDAATCRAVFSGNAALCSGSKDAESCKEFVQFIKALQQKNIVECNFIEDKDTKDYCKAVVTGNDNVCKEYAKEDCTDQVNLFYAKLYERQELCSDIENELIRQDCLQ